MYINKEELLKIRKSARLKLEYRNEKLIHAYSKLAIIVMGGILILIALSKL